MVKVYVTVKSKKLCNDFCACIDKSDFAKVADTFNTLRDCKKQLAIRLPDILLLGLDLTDGYWVDFCTKIKETYPGLKVLVITSYDEYCTFKHVLPGVTSGYISRDALPTVILSALQAVMEGQFFRYDKMAAPVEKEESSSRELLALLRDTVKKIHDEGDPHEMIEKLTLLIDTAENYRRHSIKRLITDSNDDGDAAFLNHYSALLIENLLIKGYSNWDVADMLNISIDSVRLYRLELILKISGRNTMMVNIDAQGKPILLGRREKQVLQLITAGYSYKEIAGNVLNVDIETVNSICDAMRRKFDARNAMVMVIKALRMGLITLDDVEQLIVDK